MSLAARAVVDVSQAPRRARDARTRATGRRHRVIQKASPSDAVQRAKGGDYNAAAATFVNSFFYDGNVDTRDVEYKGLTRACSSDMKKRYAGDGNALVVILDEDDSRECLACGGVEVRKYVGAVDYESYVKSGRGGMDVEGKIIERPIVANLATARAARRKGYGKAIMGCSSDMKKRYAGDGNALVVILDEDDSRECLACGGVEVRKYVGAVDYESYVKSGRGGMDVEGKIIERPIVANLATARAARRKGYGKAIMGALEDICAENGFDECCLVVEARNKRAQGLYRKLGYKVIGSDAKAAALEVVDGRSRETTTKTLVMRKSLTNPGANVDTVTIGAAVLALALLSAGQQALVDALYVNFGIDLF